MTTLPPQPDLAFLRKQAKALLRLARAADPAALARLSAGVPRAFAGPRLHHAQLCLAREYGFPSWPALLHHVEAVTLAREPGLARRWLHLAYGGDVTGTHDAARPHLAARLLQENPALAQDPAIACAAGILPTLRRALAADPAWPSRPCGPLALPPLVAVTQSRLGLLPAYLDPLRAAARLLLQAGADPNGRIGNRFPPASLAAPDGQNPLSALYGAAAVLRDPALTGTLLAAGADPNDGESLYHSLENPDCTRLLLAAGARIAGTNAVRRALDMPGEAALELLLAHGADPNEPAPPGPTAAWGAPLLRALAVRRSPRHIGALLAAGADPRARTAAGLSAYRLAELTGQAQAAALLAAAGAAEPLGEEDRFAAACARADAPAARAIQSRRPDLPGSLPPGLLRLLPDTAAWGDPAAARLMAELGWPLAVRGGDWDATALNHAVFRGDAALAASLLARGADWRERHGYGSDVLGTLSWASLNEPSGLADPDWPACARALREAGLPTPAADAADPGRLLFGTRAERFSDEVAEALLEQADTP